MSDIIAELTGAAGATIHGRLIVPDSASTTCGVAVLLDGAPAGMIGREYGGNGSVAFSYTVPNHIVCSQLDLVDPQTGAKLLPKPYNFAPEFGLKVTRFEQSGLTVSGAFTLAIDRDPALFVQFLAGNSVLGGCFANLAVKSPATRASPRGLAVDRKLTYSFTWNLASLCPLDQSYKLRLCIAGQDLRDGPELAIDARSIGLLGYVDKAEGDVVSGWAVDLAKPKRRLTVELFRDGTLIETTRADRPRKDLVAFGLGDGQSAFRFKVPEVPLGDAPVQYTVKLGGTGTQLSNSPIWLEPAPRLIGFFDDVSSGFVSGWITNLDEPDVPVEVDVVCEGQVIGGGTANISRQDVVRAGIANAQCGFRINLGTTVVRNYVGRLIEVRVRGTTRVLDGSPRQLTENPNIARFLERGKRLDANRLARLRRRLNYQAAGHHVSIIMPIHNTQHAWLIEALESVRGQWCDNWELICVNDCSTEPHVARVLDAYAKFDPRFRVLTTSENVGIARATNFGLRAARYEYVTFMDHDDYLEPDAVYCLVRTAIETSADFIYSDEVLTYEDIHNLKEVRARPSFSHDYYLSHPYFVHMLCVRCDLARQVAGWNENLAISADVDFVLRILEVAKTVAHVPTILYRWRTHAGSTGMPSRRK